MSHVALMRGGGVHQSFSIVDKNKNTANMYTYLINREETAQVGKKNISDSSLKVSNGSYASIMIFHKIFGVVLLRPSPTEVVYEIVN
jgi:hypothetical protein